MEASEKRTASSGRVTRAESSLLTNIARSSYSNSGFSTLPWARRLHSPKKCAVSAARRSLASGRGAELMVASSPRIVFLAGITECKIAREGHVPASARAAGVNLGAHPLIEIYQRIVGVR